VRSLINLVHLEYGVMLLQGYNHFRVNQVVYLVEGLVHRHEVRHFAILRVVDELLRIKFFDHQLRL
jgi:hypothetical protein